MHSKAAIVALMLAVVEARFGQEGAVQGAVQALGAFGNPGAAGTLAGQTPGVLLAGANACAKLQLADQIVAQLGNDAAVINAAKLVVQAEKNFNPFAVSIPSICSDASLPATEALRGIIPLVDPDVPGAAQQNARSAQSLNNPLAANGQSVADITAAQGFTEFTAQGSDGSNAAPAAGGNNNNNNNGGNNNNNGGNNNNNNNNGGNNNNNNNNGGNNGGAVNCGPPRTLTTVIVAQPTAAPAAGNGNNNNNNGGGNNAALDFGSCVPTINFLPGRNGRAATEFTFNAIDPAILARQSEALNPNIITNRICDELTNICGANQAAKDACQAAKAQIQALGTRDASTAVAWNTALGFPGVDVSV
ncbi:hypothetical protein QBC40DRAFT_269701 [Triangularia verruculosa]|uniref:Circumsporozoite protein n=1 Tax=Triangularia verruculosa TaxID=2587418 RepID=A0AAN6X6F6_9PEZI|nr:hypothetical protein QBC40DRAFT_269701 [Triangularia verruculosa]